MTELEPLLEEIAELLEAAEAADDPARLEQTLTDGYAHALTLEVERTTLEQHVRRLAASLGEQDGSSTSEVSALARRLEDCDVTFERLRRELARLRRRHSSAVRLAGSWTCCQTSPDRTA